MILQLEGNTIYMSIFHVVTRKLVGMFSAAARLYTSQNTYISNVIRMSFGALYTKETKISRANHDFTTNIKKEMHIYIYMNMLTLLNYFSLDKTSTKQKLIRWS